MANYFCTDSVEEQVDYLTDKVKDLKTNKLDKAAIVQEAGIGTDVVMSQKAVTDELSKKSNATNLANGAADVLIQTNDTNHSFKVMTDGRAKVQTAPVEDNDVVRNKEFTEKSKELEERSFAYYSIEAETARDYSKGGNIDKIFKDILKRIENLENKSI